MANPSTADWAALIRLTRYLIARPRCVYHFPWQGEGVLFRVDADTDFADCLHTRRSTRGGGAISWSKTQKTIAALSSGEADLGRR
eukprot:13011598-Alexandrium_andersonii.AAC.1